MSSDTLRSELAAWNGSAAALDALHAHHAEAADYPHHLAELLDTPALHKGVGGLLKRHFAAHPEMAPPELADALLTRLAELRAWEARLNFLQFLAHLPIPAARLAETTAFVRTCLADSNRFVRAWAYHGMYVLACQHPPMRGEVAEILAMGLRDEPAAVRARICHCLEQGFPENGT